MDTINKQTYLEEHIAKKKRNREIFKRCRENRNIHEIFNKIVEDGY